MQQYPHTLSDGLTVHINLRHSARKNLILRPVDRRTVSINIPPFFSNRDLARWLENNEDILRRTLAQAPETTAGRNRLPDRIWYRGIQTTLATHAGNHILTTPFAILLPDTEAGVQKQHLRRFLDQRAREYLLPRLENHARATGLIPAATALSNAKTFWGVCRGRTGIRLNRRLIGAPGYVADYVCLHELAHLRHPDHSPAFWTLVNRLTPHTQDAKHWLKTHGHELFILD